MISNADEILHLRYGVIERVERGVPHSDPVPAAPSVPEKPGGSGRTGKKERFSSFRYALRRNPKLLRPGNLFLPALVFLLVMLVSTVQNNIGSEYGRMMLKNYPTDLITCNTGELDDFPYKERLKI